MKYILGKYIHQCKRFKGRVDAVEPKGKSSFVCVRDVTLSSDDEVLASHVWIEKRTGPPVKRGDVIHFFGRVKTYLRRGNSMSGCMVQHGIIECREFEVIENGLCKATLQTESGSGS